MSIYVNKSSPHKYRESPASYGEIIQDFEDKQLNASKKAKKIFPNRLVHGKNPLKIIKYSSVLYQYLEELGGAKELARRFKKIYRHLPRNHKITTDVQTLERNLLYFNSNDRKAYRSFVKALRAVLHSSYYKELAESHPCKEFIREACHVRWSKTNIYPYLEAIEDQLLASCDSKGKKKEPKNFISQMRQNNECIKQAPRAYKKSQAALFWQKLNGALGRKDFTGTQNIPNVRSQLIYENNKGEQREITYMRHATPTLAGTRPLLLLFISRIVNRIFNRLLQREVDIRLRSGEKIASDYLEFLVAAEEKDEDVFVSIHQRSKFDIFENEADRVEALVKLQSTHKNFHVLLQPMEGDLFERKGVYQTVKTFEGLKDALLDEYCSDTPLEGRARLPRRIKDKEKYRDTMENLLDQLHCKSFINSQGAPKEKIGSNDEWRTFILLFYALQREDMMLNQFPKVKYLSTFCKDFLDRGGANAFVQERARDYQLNQDEDEEILKTREVNTLAPCIAAKKIGMVSHHLEKALKVEKHLKRLKKQGRPYKPYLDNGWMVKEIKVEV